MSSSTESPHNSHILFIGQQCHADQCYLVDFLPFRCDHCTHAFCADHYKPTAHACEKYDASKHDRIAPPCPLCNIPIAIPPDQDPNMRMEQHIEKECSVTTGKRAKQGGMPVCARGKCGKVLFAPIKCNSCDKQYCAAHRFPSSHACSPTASSSQFSVAAVGTRFFAKRSTAASAAAMATTKRNLIPAKPTPSVSMPVANAVDTKLFGKQTSAGSTTAPASTNAVKVDAGASGRSTNLFVKSKTDRRAKAEQESRRRAMQERAKKGLLSEREQMLLAEEEAVLAAESNSGKKDSECALM